MEMLVGEAFTGEGGDTAHINVLAGPRSGPLGTAFAGALANPKPGIVPFLAVLQPNIPVVPATLIVNKAAIETDRHGTLTWGAMQAGVAEGALDGRNLEEWVLIVALWNSPAASDEEAIYQNNRAAMREALLRADGKLPYAGNYRDRAITARNPFFRLSQ